MRHRLLPRVLVEGYGYGAFCASCAPVGIPAKLNANSEGKPNSIPGWSRTLSERSDAGISILQDVFAFVKKNRSARLSDSGYVGSFATAIKASEAAIDG